MQDHLYITGAGVSAESGIPTFRGEDGFWTIGSVNYTPQEMATRRMYLENPAEFLLWYFKRFVQYRHIKPNAVHNWLVHQKLITQNIDGLDGKAGNGHYIPIHGRLDKVTTLHEQGELVELEDAPWEDFSKELDSDLSDGVLKERLLDAFRISSIQKKPEINVSLKPFVLLFDEYYTELYRISEARRWMQTTTTVIFMGTSFSVGVTAMALETAIHNNCKIHVVDPKPINLGVMGIHYHKMRAAEFIERASEILG